MIGAVTLFRIQGVPIRLHASWLVMVALITWTLSVGYFPVAVPELSTADYWMYGLAAALFLFVSVFLHELSHTLVALAFGIPVSSITLHVFGGVSQMEREPDRPVAEVLIAAVGPITSFALAGLLLGLVALLDPAPSVTATLEYLAAVNALIGLFNLTPGFPLDGGRLLRAALWRYRGDIESATRTATRAGAVVAFVLVGLGSVYLVGGDFLAGTWLILIGLFLYHAGQSSYREALVARALDPFTVADVMTRQVLHVPSDLTVGRVVQDVLWQNHVSSLPVLRGPQVVGVVSLDRIKAVPHAEWLHTTVGEVMTPLTERLVVWPAEPLRDALRKLGRNGLGRAVVLDGGRLVGYLSVKDVLHVIALDAHARWAAARAARHTRARRE
jgi:Zn-dependent protease/predicted transcriptional regulator